MHTNPSFEGRARLRHIDNQLSPVVFHISPLLPPPNPCQRCQLASFCLSPIVHYLSTGLETPLEEAKLLPVLLLQRTTMCLSLKHLPSHTRFEHKLQCPPPSAISSDFQSTMPFFRHQSVRSSALEGGGKVNARLVPPAGAQASS